MFIGPEGLGVDRFGGGSGVVMMSRTEPCLLARPAYDRGYVCCPVGRDETYDDKAKNT
jgi:hypothetical protein